jgi:thiol-disulfide isomerase/thioredoxin
VKLAAAVTLAGAAVALGACSSYRTDGVVPTCVESDAGAYPPCPYGTTKGEVVADATFTGFSSFDAVSAGAKPISFHDFYDPTGQKPIKLLFVNAGAVWCGPCKEEAQELPAVYEQLKDRVAFVTVVFEGQPGVPATQNDLQAWVSSFKTPFWGVIDPNRSILAYFDKSTPPYSMVIDTATMTIVDQFVGKPDDVEKFISSHLPP